MANRIKVGISTYNDYEYLGMLLQSIDWYTVVDEPFDIVVCDDGSRPELLGSVDNPDSIRGICSKFGATLVENGTNKGIPAAWNQLVTSLGGPAEINVILNNDILVVPNWLRVIIHFLTANKDNPHVSSTFWNPYNNFPKEAMKSVLPNLWHTNYASFDQVTGKPLSHSVGNLLTIREGQGQGLGRVMCPCGCCFAARGDVFTTVGIFKEELLSFHEETVWGVLCAKAGRAAFGFAYPRPYHKWGAAFHDNPELQHSFRMEHSRKLFREMFNVPSDIGLHEYLPWVNSQFMPQIPLTKLKYLRPDYDLPPDTRILKGGETVQLPALVEFEEEF